MKIVKFEGSTLREALARVKAELGDQAVIVSTRQVRRGLLGSAYEIAAAIEPEDERPSERATGPRVSGSASPSTAYAAAGASAPSRGPAVDAMAPMKAELRSLRAMVRANGDGKATSELRNELASLRKLVHELRGAATPAAAPVAPTRAAQLAAGSTAQVVALVGPTGVGKTTTIAKIAARAALVDGRSVAIISLDNYRVGGLAQIKTFADLIGVPLAVAERPGELIEHVAQLDEHDLILVDTAGRSPRDGRALDELARALGRVRGLETHLAIAAATPASLIDELHRQYAGLKPARLLFTKLDETGACPELVGAPTRLGLPITWLTTGQAVPEDLEEATTQRLIDLSTTAIALPASASQHAA